MGQSTTISSDMMIKYGSVICLIVFGSIIFIYLVYLLLNRKPKKSFEGDRSLDTIYDDAGGNDPLSNGRLTSDINLSTDKYSCKFQILYEGNNKRSVECISGCDDENSEFCKRYIYNESNNDLDNPLLDKTYTDRKSEN